MTRFVLLALSVSVFAITHTRSGLQETELLPSDGVHGARFGTAVAVDGYTAAIGAPRDVNANGVAGAVYIFERADGRWSEEQKLLADDGSQLDLFGKTLAIDGDTLLVGAPDDDPNGIQSGSAYIFVRDGGVWTQQAKLTPNDGSEWERFGLSVDLDGDLAVVGRYIGDGIAVGNAYVFERSGDIWPQKAKLSANDGTASDAFSWSVAIDGDVVAVGAPNHNDQGQNAGAVYTYRLFSGINNWTILTKLTASDAEPGVHFGNSVSMDGDTLAVGSFQDNDNGFWSGSAYVFRRTPGAWSEEAKLLASDGGVDEYFGRSVSVQGDTIVVGAPGLVTGGTVFGGGAYVFGLIQDEWTERFKLDPSEVAELARFGTSVAVVGRYAIVGGWGDDDFGTESGTAYAYEIPTAPPDKVPALGGIGTVLLLLTVAGTGAGLLYRRG